MKIFDFLRMTMLNLYGRISHYLINIIGIVIGTTCIIVMISIGITNTAHLDEMLKDTNLNMIDVSINAVNNIKNLKLDSQTIMTLSNMDNVALVIPKKQLTFYGEIDKYYSPSLIVTTVPLQMMDYLFDIEDGRKISSDSMMLQGIVGKGIFNTFIEDEDDYNIDYKGPKIKLLDSQIDLYLGGEYAKNNPSLPASHQHKLNIVGVLSGTNNNNEIYISLEDAYEILKSDYKLANKLDINFNEYDSITVYTNTLKDIDGVIEKIRSYGFAANSNSEIISDIKDKQKAQQGQLLAIGLITLIISFSGMVNVTMMSIYNSKKEIAIMKIVGMSNKKIRSLFLLESMVIGLIGGILSIITVHILSYIIAGSIEGINIIGLTFDAGLNLIIPYWLDLSAIALTIILGVITGLWSTKRVV